MGTARPFRFGVINEQMESASAWTERARRAEDQGYATFLIRDHFVADPFPDQFAPLTALMAAASVTTTLRVGTLVIDNDYRHPAVLAKEAATLDVLSSGRLELGLGAGWLRAEYEKAGIPFDTPGTRIARLEESIHVLKGLFAGGPLTFAGRHYSINGLNGFPLPLQRPHPPILVGGGGQRILTLAGRVADTVGILNTSVATGVQLDDPTDRRAASVAQKIGWVRQGAGDRFPAVELSMIMSVVAITDARRLGAEQLIRERHWNGVTADDVLEMPSISIGSLDQIVEDTHARRARYGLSYFVVADRHMDAVAPIVARLAGK